MKNVKRVITTVAIGMMLSPTLNASTQYEATLTDVKESLFYLINDYDSTTGAIKDNKKNIKSIKTKISENSSKATSSREALNKEIVALNSKVDVIASAENITKVDIEKLKELARVQNKHIKSLDARNLQKVHTDKELDKKITDFLEEK